MKETRKSRIMDPLKGYKTIIHSVAESWKSLCLSCDLEGIFILLPIYFYLYRSVYLLSTYIYTYVCTDSRIYQLWEEWKMRKKAESLNLVGLLAVGGSQRGRWLTCISIFLCMCLPLEVLNRPDADKGEADIWIHSEQILCQGCGIRGMAKGCWCGKLWIMRVVEAGGLINGDKVKIPVELEGQYSGSTQVVKPWDRKLTW